MAQMKELIVTAVKTAIVLKSVSYSLFMSEMMLIKEWSQLAVALSSCFLAIVS